MYRNTPEECLILKAMMDNPIMSIINGKHCFPQSHTTITNRSVCAGFKKTHNINLYPIFWGCTHGLDGRCALLCWQWTPWGYHPVECLLSWSRSAQGQTTSSPSQAPYQKLPPLFHAVGAKPFQTCVAPTDALSSAREEYGSVITWTVAFSFEKHAGIWT